MTEPPRTGRDHAGRSSLPPLAPKPTTLLAALIVAAVLIYNLQLDAGSATYDGAKVTYGLVFGLLFILGVDLSRFWPSDRDK